VEAVVSFEDLKLLFLKQFVMTTNSRVCLVPLEILVDTLETLL